MDPPGSVTCPPSFFPVNETAGVLPIISNFLFRVLKNTEAGSRSAVRARERDHRRLDGGTRVGYRITYPSKCTDEQRRKSLNRGSTPAPVLFVLREKLKGLR